LSTPVFESSPPAFFSGEEAKFIKLNVVSRFETERIHFEKLKKNEKVTGLGGIFFKSINPANTRQWYERHLGMNMDEYGHMFSWKSTEDEQEIGLTQWSVFKEDTTYFSPSKQPFMINYRVVDLEALLVELKKEGVEQVGEIQIESYGKFAWIMDPDGQKIELWEPTNPEAFHT
jgi:predicted enzyme related to lactoylglutathione lyase